MTWNELSNIISSLDNKLKSGYEQTRMIVHSIYQVNSSKELKPTDVLKFSWDIDNIETELKPLSYSEAEQLINNIK